MNKRGFAGLLEILIAIAIIGALMYFMLKRYAGGTLTNKETKQIMSEQGIDTASYKTVVDTARTSVNEIQKKQQQQLNQMNDYVSNISE